jgi:hypothetical protein
MILLPLTVSEGEDGGCPVCVGADAGDGSETVQVRRAGDRSIRRPLTARTRNVWRPSFSPEYVAGDVQRRKAAPSSEHRKLERFRLDRNENETACELDTPPETGPLVIRVFGAFDGRAAGAGPAQARPSRPVRASARRVRAEETTTHC